MADKTQPEAQPQAQPLPGEGQAQAADEPKSAPADDKKPAYLSEDQPLQLKDYEEPKAAEPAPWWQQVLGFGFKLLMVIGLIFGSLAAVKKLSGGRMALNLPNTKGRNIVVLESTHLNPQQAIHMISLGGERLLVVGAGPQGLSTLTEITDPQQVRLFLQAQKTTPSASAFNQVFDLERVVQDTNSELLGETLREVDDDPRFNRGRRKWPGT
jgi:flagellar biogenesis protein FliO